MVAGCAPISLSYRRHVAAPVQFHFLENSIEQYAEAALGNRGYFLQRLDQRIEMFLMATG
jgi:hypothetical protein